MVKTNPEEKIQKMHHPEAKGLFLLSISLFILLCLLSFKNGHIDANWLGLIGYWTAWTFSVTLGLGTYLIIFYSSWLGWRMLCNREFSAISIKNFYFSLFLISCCILLNLYAEAGAPLPAFIKDRITNESTLIHLPYPHRSIRYHLGGVPLYYIYRDLPMFNLQRMLSDVGIALTFSIIEIVSFLLLTEVRLFSLIRSLKIFAASKPYRRFYLWLKGQEKPDEIKTSPIPDLNAEEDIEKNHAKASPPKPLYQPQPLFEKKIRTGSDHFSKQEKEIKATEPPKSSFFKKEPIPSAPRVQNGDFTTYQIPPASLLNNPKKVDQPSLKKELRRQAEILEETLLSFGIEAKVGEINCGPTITSFEVHPAIGVKVQKITALENDIALNLQAKSIRIIAPIPGKAAVGVEIPSLYPQEVSFKEMLQNYQQNPRKFH
ncbi:MAG: DNA translocase FtsK 4TM domain-containing protein, partial [Anaerolineae bacterium]